MSSSFISKDHEHGFWIKDSRLKIICWGLVNVIDASPDEAGIWMKGEFRDYLYSSSLGFFPGFTSLRLSTYLISQERIAEFNKTITRTKDFFLRKGEFIPKEELNAFQTEKQTRNVWASDLETRVAIKILDYLEEVVNDRITIRVDDKIDYEF